MTTPDLFGTAGVSLLLLAYFLNLFKLIRQESRLYGLLNLVGSGLACYASVLIGFIPFVVLEVTWALVAIIGIVRHQVPKNA